MAATPIYVALAVNNCHGLQHAKTCIETRLLTTWASTNAVTALVFIVNSMTDRN